MREWYDDHQIDVASQATFDYIEWKEVDAEDDDEEGAAGKGLSGFFTASELADERTEHSRRLAAMDAQIAAEAAEAMKAKM